MNLKRLSEMRAYTEPGYDSREVALSILNKKEIEWPILRKKPCHDCAVTDGLYTGIASCCFHYLTNEEKDKVVRGWQCHNGGRCEGAALVIQGKEEYEI